jgi:hypothetical protein
MFDYTKLVLQKVSFDKNLFRKELMKALGNLQPHEQQMLKIWCATTFAVYSDVIVEVFRSLSS